MADASVEELRAIIGAYRTAETHVRTARAALRELNVIAFEDPNGYLERSQRSLALLDEHIAQVLVSPLEEALS